MAARLPMRRNGGVEAGAVGGCPGCGRGDGLMGVERAGCWRMGLMKFADVTDTLLEPAVVPSFSRIGPVVRSRLDHWTSSDAYRWTGA